MIPGSEENIIGQVSNANSLGTNDQPARRWKSRFRCRRSCENSATLKVTGSPARTFIVGAKAGRMWEATGSAPPDYPFKKLLVLQPR